MHPDGNKRLVRALKSEENAYMVPTMYPKVLPEGEYLKLFADAAWLCKVCGREESRFETGYDG